MTHGNQCELTLQENMKKQSDSLKGKCRDDGLSAVTHNLGTSICCRCSPRKDKKQTNNYLAFRVSGFLFYFFLSFTVYWQF
uniref:Uncharacterized protein n=1 Tax=Sus scrofa TaxID=9823 RepID=A0A4X1V0Q5_PIG